MEDRSLTEAIDKVVRDCLYETSKIHESVDYLNILGKTQPVGRRKDEGFIIAGYPCIGKSSIFGMQYRIPIIDLESSNFNKDNRLWYIDYIKVAEHLAKQGFVVFVSTHSDVIQCLKNVSCKVFVICPHPNLQSFWIEKLQSRYDKTKLDKDKRALERVVSFYKSDVDNLIKCGLPVVTIPIREYRLEDIVLSMFRNVQKISTET